ncbi:PhoH family protein [Aerococcus vaginalis]
MTESLISKKIELRHPENALVIFGVQDSHLKLMESTFGVMIAARGDQAEIRGSERAVHTVMDLIQVFDQMLYDGKTLSEQDILSGMHLASRNQLQQFKHQYDAPIGKTFEGKQIRPKTDGQKDYINAIKKHPITFGIGAAGTGKTFLAIVMAVRALKNGEVKRIILTRPAVEAGESLGFLPGDLKEKVDPYLRPVYDALYSIYGVEHTDRLLERNIIEIAPLAYMRGRTLDDAFVILDESQNTTVAQMKMFLTRLGYGSHMVVNGDATQIDLPRGVRSGLLDAQEKLQDIPEVGFIRFSSDDVVRHPVVSKIIDAYEKPKKMSDTVTEEGENA